MRLESGRYVDGAVYSPTNADVVAPLGFDLVIVSAPMSADPEARADQGGLAGRARGWFAGLVDREVAAVAERGAATLVIEPGRAELLAMRSDLPDRELGPLVADAASSRSGPDSTTRTPGTLDLLPGPTTDGAATTGQTPMVPPRRGQAPGSWPTSRRASRSARRSRRATVGLRWPTSP